MPKQNYDDDAVVPPGFSDDALAEAFTFEHGEDMRYVAGWGRWYYWSGNVWKPDSTLRALDRARKICRAAAARCASKKLPIVSRLGSAATVAAVERLAKSDRRHAATVEQWDAVRIYHAAGSFQDARSIAVFG
jgi:phage/plasmid-associated DNA primase